MSAEGHLGLHKNGNSLIPKFQIAVRADDCGLLRELRKRTGGFGHIYDDRRRTQRRPHPTVAWQVRDGVGLAGLVMALDRCPPRGRRGDEYRIWREAALEYGSSKSRADVQRRLRELRPRLDAVRRGAASSVGP